MNASTLIHRRITLSSRGFTLLELIVTFAIMAIVITLALPKFSRLEGEMAASEVVQQLASDLSEMRAEAIRLRTNIRISFSATGYSWNIDDDTTTEGSRTLGHSAAWSGGTPSSILFNGLGLVRGISTQTTITISSRGSKSSMTINSNGHITL